MVAAYFIKAAWDSFALQMLNSVLEAVFFGKPRREHIPLCFEAVFTLIFVVCFRSAGRSNIGFLGLKFTVQWRKNVRRPLVKMIVCVFALLHKRQWNYRNTLEPVLTVTLSPIPAEWGIMRKALATLECNLLQPQPEGYKPSFCIEGEIWAGIVMIVWWQVLC